MSFSIIEQHSYNSKKYDELLNKDCIIFNGKKFEVTSSKDPSSQERKTHDLMREFVNPSVFHAIQMLSTKFQLRCVVPYDNTNPGNVLMLDGHSDFWSSSVPQILQLQDGPENKNSDTNNSVTRNLAQLGQKIVKYFTTCPLIDNFAVETDAMVRDEIIGCFPHTQSEILTDIRKKIENAFCVAGVEHKLFKLCAVAAKQISSDKLLLAKEKESAIDNYVDVLTKYIATKIICSYKFQKKEIQAPDVKQYNTLLNDGCIIFNDCSIKYGKSNNSLNIERKQHAKMKKYVNSSVLDVVYSVSKKLQEICHSRLKNVTGPIERIELKSIFWDPSIPQTLGVTVGQYNLPSTAQDLAGSYHQIIEFLQKYPVSEHSVVTNEKVTQDEIVKLCKQTNKVVFSDIKRKLLIVFRTIAQVENIFLSDFVLANTQSLSATTLSKEFQERALEEFMNTLTWYTIAKIIDRCSIEK